MSMEGRDRKFVWMLTWRDLTLPTQQPAPPKGRSSQPWLSAEPPEEFHILLVPRLNPRPVNQNLWRQNAGICIFKVFLGDSFGQLGMRILQWIIVFSHLIFFQNASGGKNFVRKFSLERVKHREAEFLPQFLDAGMFKASAFMGPAGDLMSEAGWRPQGHPGSARPAGGGQVLSGFCTVLPCGWFF